MMKFMFIEGNFDAISMDAIMNEGEDSNAI